MSEDMVQAKSKLILSTKRIRFVACSSFQFVLARSRE